VTTPKTKMLAKSCIQKISTLFMLLFPLCHALIHLIS
jgi:hypothetical protein